MLRTGPSVKLVVMIEKPAGALNAALTPVTNRAAMRSGPSVAKPPSAVATANTTSEPISIHAAPEQVGGAPAEQQETAEAEDVTADHPLQRGGGQTELGADRRQRDAFIETSSASRNIAPQRTRSRPRARGVMRSWAAAGDVETVKGTPK